MNKQISDPTGLVLALTEMLSSNVGEGSKPSTASDKNCTRSDIFVIDNHQTEVKHYIASWRHTKPGTISR